MGCSFLSHIEKMLVVTQDVGIGCLFPQVTKVARGDRGRTGQRETSW